MIALLGGTFLIAHGLIHASYLAPAPTAGSGPAWPFDMASSWLVARVGLDTGVVRAIGTLLVGVTVIGFGIAGLSVLGLVPTAVFAPVVVASALTSIAVLSLFFHPWIVLGFAIDAILLWIVVSQGWTPARL